MRKRARKARELRDRILDAAYEMLATSYVSDVSLASIAEAAGCSEQTLYRKFGSKDGLIRALGEREGPDMSASRDAIARGDVEGAVARVVADYEAAGDVMILMQAQVERVDALREMFERGRDHHHAWVHRVFAPWLECMCDADARLAHAQLVVALDVQTWKRLRWGLELDEERTHQAMKAMTDAVLAQLPGGDR